MFNTEGKLIFTSSIINDQDYYFDINVATGIYIVEIKSSNFTKQIKLIKN